MRKSIVKFSIVLLLLQLLLSLSVPASMADINGSPLETPPLANDSFQPAIDGDKVVYINGTAGVAPEHSNVYLKTIGGGAPQKLSTVKHAHAPAIGAGRVVWEDLRNDAPGPETDNSDMFGYALPAGPEAAIDTNASAQLDPDTSGGRTVWADNRNGNWDIYLKNTNGVVSQITTDPGMQIEPRIDGDLIVWGDNRNGNDDIYLYNIATATETRITNNSANQNGPDISGRKIVWTDWRGTRNIYVYDLDSPVANGDAAAPSAAVQHSARISGNRVVWTDWRNEALNVGFPGYNSDVYAKNLIDSQVTQITDDIWQQNSPDVSGNRVVWADWRSGSWNIYLYEFPLPTGTIVINNGAAYTNSPSVTLNLTTNGGAEMSLSTDTTAWTPWEPYPVSDSKNYTLSSGDGAKTVYAKFKDGAGAESTPAVSDSIILDTALPLDPEIGVSTPAPGAWANDNTINVNWAGASDGAGSGIDGYSVSWTQNSSPTPDTTLDLQESAVSATSAPLADGAWWFNLRTKDNAGNWTSTVHEGPFMVDATLPTNPTSAAESAGASSGVWQNTNNGPSFTWPAGTDTLSGVDGYYYYWGPNPAGTSTDYTTQTALDPPPVVNPSVNYLRVRTKDTAGNLADWTTLFTFKYDAESPLDPTITTSTPAPGAWANDNTINVDWAGASDGAGSGIDGYSVSWTQNSSPTPDTTLDLQESAVSATSAPLADGTWWFNLRTKDNTGNWTSTRHAGPFMIDTVNPTNPPPATETGGALSGVWQNSIAAPNFTWLSGADSSSGVKGYYYYWGTDPAGAPTTWTASAAYNPPAVGGSGTYYLRIKTEDNAGNQSAAATLFTFRYDIGDPSNPTSATEASGAPDNSWQNSVPDPDFNWPAGTDGVSGVKGYYYYWGPSSTGAPTTWTTSQNFDPPAVANPSIYYLRVKTEDNAGNQSAVSTIFTFKYDANRPGNPTSTTEIGGAANGIWQKTDNDPDFTWSGASSGAASPVDGYYYYWGPNPAGTSTNYTTQTAFDPPPVLNPSVNFLRVQTKDTAGNLADWTTLFTFKYDAESALDPTITTSTPAPGAWANDNTINANWAGASDGDGSGVDGYSVSWTQNATETPDMTVDLQENDTSATSSPQADGTWYFHLRTKDNAGNWTSTVHEGPFRIDTSAPANPNSTTEIGGAANGIWQKTDNDPDFAWSGAADAAGSGVKGYYYYWGPSSTGAPTTSIASAAYNPPAVGGSGTYYLRVKTEDYAGNQSAPETLFVFKYDSVAPSNPTSVIEAGGAVSGAWQKNIADPRFTWGAATDADSGVDGYDYYWGPEIGGNLASRTATAEFDPPPVPGSGRYYLKVRTVDQAGNQSSGWVTFIFDYDGDPPPDPSPTSSSHTTGVWSRDNTVDLSWFKPLDLSVVVGYSTSWSRDTQTLPDTTVDQAAAIVTAASPALADGTWWFNLRTKDTAGNWTSTVHVGPFKIDNTAPSASMSSPAISTTISKTKIFRVSWAGADGGSGAASYDLQYKIGAGGAWTGWKSGTTAKSADFTIGVPGKTYYFRVRAKDVVGITGAWTTAAVKTIVPFDQSTKAIIAKRVGFAGTLSKAGSGHYLGTLRYSKVAGEYITYKATGNYFALIADKGKGRGKAAIFIDGKRKKTIDTGAKSTKYRQVVYSISFPKVGKHTIKIVNKGTAGRPRINLDGVAVGN